MILSKVREESSSTTITLLYGTKEERFNNAVALKDTSKRKLKNIIAR